MSWFWKHCLVGNDMPAMVIAACRALALGVMVGLFWGLKDFQAHAEYQSAIVSGLEMALTYLMVRAGIEGWIDYRKEKNGGGS